MTEKMRELIIQRLHDNHLDQFIGLVKNMTDYEVFITWATKRIKVDYEIYKAFL